jgi:hypothetical protein
MLHQTNELQERDGDIISDQWEVGLKDSSMVYQRGGSREQMIDLIQISDTNI